MTYFVAYGINPEWPLFVKPIHNAHTNGELNCRKAQEVVRKDMEILFGIMQAGF